eukprot:PhF_6_TR29163/c1_g1_i1/m.42630
MCSIQPLHAPLSGLSEGNLHNFIVDEPTKELLVCYSELTRFAQLFPVRGGNMVCTNKILQASESISHLFEIMYPGTKQTTLTVVRCVASVFGTLLSHDHVASLLFTMQTSVCFKQLMSTKTQYEMKSKSFFLSNVWQPVSRNTRVSATIPLASSACKYVPNQVFVIDDTEVEKMNRALCEITTHVEDVFPEIGALLQQFSECSDRDYATCVMNMMESIPRMRSAGKQWVSGFTGLWRLAKAGRPVDVTYLRHGIQILRLLRIIHRTLLITLPNLQDDAEFEDLTSVQEVGTMLDLLNLHSGGSLRMMLEKLQVTLTREHDFPMPTETLHSDKVETVGELCGRDGENVTEKFKFAAVAKERETIEAATFEPTGFDVEASVSSVLSVGVRPSLQTLSNVDIRGAELIGSNANDPTTVKPTTSHHSIQKRIEEFARKEHTKHEFGLESGAALTEAYAQSFMQSNQIDSSLIRAAAKQQQDIQQLYAKLSTRVRETSGNILRFNMDVPPRIAKWTFQKLCECEAIVKYISYVVDKLREVEKQLSHNKMGEQKFEWCIVMDSSGSMSRFANESAEALAVFIESFRRMEFSFAVCRAGDPADQYPILKRFGDEFSYPRGQQMLEMLTYDHSSYLCTSLHRICRDLWSTTSEHNTHRFLVVVSDGAIPEKEANDWEKLLTDYKVHLNVLTIADPASAHVLLAHEKVMENFKDHGVLHAKILDIASLSETVGNILCKSFSCCVEKLIKSGKTSEPPVVKISALMKMGQQMSSYDLVSAVQQCLSLKMDSSTKLFTFRRQASPTHSGEPGKRISSDDSRSPGTTLAWVVANEQKLGHGHANCRPDR